MYGATPSLLRRRSINLSDKKREISFTFSLHFRLRSLPLLQFRED